MKRLLVAACALISAPLISLVVAGCGSSSHQTLFLTSSGTPTVGSFEITGNGALALTSNNTTTGSNPQVIRLTSNRKYCYVLNNAGPTIYGGIFQYTVNTGSGTLAVVEAPNASSTLTQQVSPAVTGLQPTSMVLDPSSSFVLVANSGSNTISVFVIDQTDGALTPVTGSPFSAGNKPVAIAATSSAVFVANQADGTIAEYSFDQKTGALTLSGTTPVGTNTTALAADSGGKNLFVADGTANTVTTFSISGSSLSGGSPTTVGTTPLNLFIDKSGSHLYVANSGSNNISGFSIGSGSLTALSGSPYTAGTAPSFITATTSGSTIFVANAGSSNVSSYTAASDGSLTALSNSPFSAPGYTSPNGLASSF